MVTPSVFATCSNGWPLTVKMVGITFFVVCAFIGWPWKQT